MSKRIKIMIAAVMLLCFFSGCQSGEEGEGAKVVDTYLAGTESVPAMGVEDGVNASESEPSAYAYVGLEDAGGSVGAYVERMTSEENGFRIVNKSLRKAEAPDFTQEKGWVYLAKESAEEEGKFFVLAIEWSPSICTVVASIQDAPTGQGQDAPEETEALTHTDTVERIQAMQPSVFGLDGTSMSEYNIYVRNGLVMVNGEACIWVEIYTDENPAQTNIPEGTYYLSRDGKRLYRLNRSDNTVQELKL